MSNRVVIVEPAYQVDDVLLDDAGLWSALPGTALEHDLRLLRPRQRGDIGILLSERLDGAGSDLGQIRSMRRICPMTTSRPCPRAAAVVRSHV